MKGNIRWLEARVEKRPAKSFAKKRRWFLLRGRASGRWNEAASGGPIPEPLTISKRSRTMAGPDVRRLDSFSPNTSEPFDGASYGSGI